VTHYTYDLDPQRTPEAGGIAQHFAQGAQVDAQWWRLFRSPNLDSVVSEALAGNPGLEAARASLRESEHSLRSGYGVFFPRADADAGALRERYSPAMIGEDLPGKVFNLFTLSASVSYALDVFGGQRRLIEGLRAQRDVASATADATWLALSANIVNTVIARAAYQAQLQATRELVTLEAEQVRLTEVQVQAGTAAYSTVLSLRSLLDSTRATIPQLEQRVVQSDDLLATLAGHTPAEWRAPQVTLRELNLPAELPVSLPSEIVRQRPDIMAAEATAHAASANVGISTAAMLPSVTLSGSAGGDSTTTGALFGTNARSWSAGAGVTAPLFQGGTLWFRRKAAIDAYDQAMALYRQTVLSAFAQVADTLQALDHDASALQAEDDALAAAADALHLVQVNYEAGVATYLDVLNADAQFHQTTVAQLQAVALRSQDTVALFAALGGGWWSDTHPLAGPAPEEGAVIAH
jgi:NodT family efflux transporter outer membrane factor (OMF) lipoprotein